MKHFLRATALTCAVLCLTIGISTAPAHAALDRNGDVVRTAQMRLASLGYYVGRYDGAMGPVTETAIMDFQRNNGLPTTGYLSPETYSRLAIADHDDYRHNYYGYNHSGYDMPIASSWDWDTRWHYVHAETIPTRFGNLALNEDDRGTLRHYVVTYNGHPVLFANNQPFVLRVSRTFQLDGQDAVIFTAYHGDGTCAYKNYLMTMHSDGSFNSPRELGNCAGNYEAHVADNALLVSFPGNVGIGSWSTWDVWRYQDDSMIRL
jgi:hypothetical protein